MVLLAQSCTTDGEHCEPKEDSLFDELDYSHGDRCPLLLNSCGYLDISPGELKLRPATPEAASTLTFSITGFVDGRELNNEGDPREGCKQGEAISPSGETMLHTPADGYMVDLEITEPNDHEQADLAEKADQETGCELDAFRFVTDGNPTCTFSSPTQGRCILAATGIASVTIATNRLAGGTDRCYLRARSGKQTAKAELSVVLPPEEVTLSIDVPSASAGCSVQEPCPFRGVPDCADLFSTDEPRCGDATQGVDFVVHTTRNGEIIATGQPTTATVSALATSQPPGDSWIGIEGCGDKNRSISRAVSGSTGSTTPLYMCTDAAGGTFELRAAMKDSQPTAVRVSAPALPSRLRFNRDALPPQFRVVDCHGRGVSTTVDVTVGDAQQILQTDPSGNAAITIVQSVAGLPVRFDLVEWGVACVNNPP